jgi:eukaryotic-like serine/threonine-protein kinase
VTGSTRQVRVFVSSPTDASFERSRLDRVIERLNGEFQGVARVTSIRWETEFYRAHETFQKQIPESGACDLVVAIFRARLGTALPAEFPRMADGRPYPSGTAYEVLSAIENAKGQGFPDVYVFRFPQPPSVQLDDPQRAEIEAQWERLKAFFDTWFRTPEGQFKAAFHTFGSTDDFETQVEGLLRKWLEEKVLHGRSVIWPVAIKGSPFRGLAAFGAKHAPVFFGRSRDITKATDRLKDAAEKGCAFLLVDGASGAGKSSLARAGLVARVTAAGVVPSIDVWRTAVMRPGDLSGDPFAALAHALFVRDEDLPDHEQGRPEALPELAEGNFDTPEALSVQLAHADITSLKPVLDSLAAIERESSKKGGYDRAVKAALLLVVDQLDELFGGEIGEDVRARFAQLLRLLARSGRVWIIATLRADLFDRYLAQPDLKQLKDDGASYDLAPLDVAELGEIVRAPAAAADLIYETDSSTGERLDERLLKDAERPDLLPLLQFTLNQLFEAGAKDGGKTVLTFAGYRALGGLEGAVDKEAEAALARLSEAERGRLPRLLRDLAAPARDGSVSAGYGGFDIRAVPLVEAAHDEAAANLVKALVDARILLSAGEGNEATVRLAHARVLDSWERAKKIVGENADFYRIRAWVDEQQRRWEAAERSRDFLIGRGRPLAEAETVMRGFAEELSPGMRDFIKRSGRRARLRQTVTAAAAVVFAIVAMAAVVAAQQAFHHRQVAEEQRLIAEKERQVAEEQRRRAEQTLAAATKTANGLVLDLAQRFKNTVGVPAALVKDILDRARALQQQLAESGQVTSALQRSEAMALNEKVETLLKIGDTAGAFTAADRARQIMESLLTTNPGNANWQRGLSISYRNLGDVLMATGQREEALAAYQKSLAIREKLATSERRNPNRELDLSMIHERIGDVLLVAGRREESLAAYKKSLAIRERFAVSNPNNARWQQPLSVSYDKIGDILLAAGQREEALAAYRKSLAIREKLATSDPDNSMGQRDLSISYNKVGDMLLAARQRQEALASYQKSLAIREKLAASDPGNAQWQRDVALSYDHIGDILRAEGRRAEALVPYQKSLAIRETLAARDPGNAVGQRDLSISYNKVGDMLLAARQRQEALASYQKSLVIRERLAASDPGNAQWQRDLTVGYQEVAKVLVLEGRRDEALAAYQKSLSIRETLAASDPGNARWQRDLSVSYDHIGDVQLAAGRHEEALAVYRKSLAVREKVAATDPGNAEWQRDLSMRYDKIAEVLVATGRREEALAEFQKSLAIRQTLAAKNEGNAQWQRDLFFSHSKIGNILVATGRRDEALTAYQNSLAIAEKLAATNPGETEWQRNLSVNHTKIGVVLEAAGRNEEAFAAYQKGLVIIQKLAISAPGNAQWQDALQISIDRIGNMAYHFVAAREFARALDASDQAISLAPAKKWLHSNRAHALMFLGRVEEARVLYLNYRGEKDVVDGKSWEMAILEDFAEWRKIGLTSPLMDEIETLFTGKT